MSECATRYCKNKVAPKRRYCNTCKSKHYAEANPMRYSFNNLKQNAKRRGKEFTITFEDFKQFCYLTDYMIGKGRTKNSYSIDRIDETKGYILGNLQMLPVGQNKQKHLQYVWQTKAATVLITGQRSNEWFDE